VRGVFVVEVVDAMTSGERRHAWRRAEAQLYEVVQAKAWPQFLVMTRIIGLARGEGKINTGDFPATRLHENL
jgi:hypothetical protein